MIISKPATFYLLSYYIDFDDYYIALTTNFSSNFPDTQYLFSGCSSTAPTIVPLTFSTHGDCYTWNLVLSTNNNTSMISSSNNDQYLSICVNSSTNDASLCWETTPTTTWTLRTTISAMEVGSISGTVSGKSYVISRNDQTPTLVLSSQSSDSDNNYQSIMAPNGNGTQ